MNTRIGSLVLLVLVLQVTGCGGGGGNPIEIPIPIGISISPPAANLNQGGTASFTATVSGTSNSGVTWTVREGAAGGSITSMGVYTAPNRSGTFHVIATSQADMTSSATAPVTIAAVAISLNQTAVTIDVGNQFTFVANVSECNRDGKYGRLLGRTRRHVWRQHHQFGPLHRSRDRRNLSRDCHERGGQHPNDNGNRHRRDTYGVGLPGKQRVRTTGGS